MKPALFVAPALLCAVISYQALLGSVHQRPAYWQCAFYALLPGCFMLLAVLTYKMNRDISRLRRRIGRLEHRVSAGAAGADRAGAAGMPAEGLPAREPVPSAKEGPGLGG